MDKLTKKAEVDSDDFYRGLKVEGVDLRGLLWPLACLSPRERTVFTEYHYWNTHIVRLKLAKSKVLLSSRPKHIHSPGLPL